MSRWGDRVRYYVGPHPWVGAGFLLITLIQTWPLASRLAGVLPNDLGDPVLNTWILWWNAHALPLTRAWWDAPMFFPTKGAMAFSETLLGLSWIASPMQALGATPVTAYNVLFLLSFPLSALAAYALAWTLTRRVAPSIAAGVMYGYAHFRFAHLGHLQILWSWWMPLALLALHRWMQEGRRRWLLLFGVAWLGESLSNGYYFFYFSLIIGLWLLWFTPWRDARRHRLWPVLIALVVAVAMMAPVLLTYARVQRENGFARGFGEITANSADLVEFFTAPPINNEERRVTIGVVATLALLAGMVVPLRDMITRTRREDRSPLAFYVLATVVGLVLAMGPILRVGGVDLIRNGPYAWLMTIVPGFNGVRVPARFTLVAVLCLSIATAVLLARLRRGWIAIVVAAIALMEVWLKPIPLMPLPPLLDAVALTPHASAVLELPVEKYQDFPALYRSMFHRRPLVNGYSGYTPRSYDALRACLDRKREDCLTAIRQAGSIDVVIDRGNDRDHAWELFVSQLPDAQFRYQTRQFTVFHLAAIP